MQNEPRHPEQNMTPSLARAARAILNWSMGDLAAVCGVSVETIGNYENGSFKRRPRGINKVNKVAMARAFGDAGIEFIDQPGPGLIVRRPELLDNPPKSRPSARKEPA